MQPQSYWYSLTHIWEIYWKCQHNCWQLPWSLFCIFVCTSIHCYSQWFGIFSILSRGWAVLLPIWQDHSTRSQAIFSIHQFLPGWVYTAAKPMEFCILVYYSVCWLTSGSWSGLKDTDYSVADGSKDHFYIFESILGLFYRYWDFHGEEVDVVIGWESGIRVYRSGDGLFSGAHQVVTFDIIMQYTTMEDNK